MSNFSADLELAQTMADAADQIALGRFMALDLNVETKPDRSPVTDADRAVELALRAILAEVRPTDGLIGEEFGNSDGGNRVWIIDPIDGTANYLRGVPVWATLLAAGDFGRELRLKPVDFQRVNCLYLFFDGEGERTSFRGLKLFGTTVQSSVSR